MDQKKVLQHNEMTLCSTSCTALFPVPFPFAKSNEQPFHGQVGIVSGRQLPQGDQHLLWPLTVISKIDLMLLSPHGKLVGHPSRFDIPAKQTEMSPPLNSSNRRSSDRHASDCGRKGTLESCTVLRENATSRSEQAHFRAAPAANHAEKKGEWISTSVHQQETADGGPPSDIGARCNSNRKHL